MINDEESPYIDNSIEGGDSARVCAEWDLYMLGGGITHGEIRKWKSLIRNFERGRYGWRQVLGHAASARFYSTSGDNERWNIQK